MLRVLLASHVYFLCVDVGDTLLLARVMSGGYCWAGVVFFVDGACCRGYR